MTLLLRTPQWQTVMPARKQQRNIFPRFPSPCPHFSGATVVISSNVAPSVQCGVANGSPGQRNGVIGNRKSTSFSYIQH